MGRRTGSAHNRPDSLPGAMLEMRSSRSIHLSVRGLDYHVRVWGPEAAPPARTLVMLHGWMDVSASFQFLVDALSADWRVIAPDWRGFGQSAASGADAYWFPDYLGDLEALLLALLPEARAHLVGHSMGGNVAMLYAGIRPERVASVVNLEGFGLRSTQPSQAPRRYARWLDELQAPARLKTYPNLEDVIARLCANNPRLSRERAEFLAPHWARRVGEVWELAADPAHKRSNPVLYRWEEVAACWSAIEAPVLWVQASATEAHAWAGEQAEIDARRGIVPRLEAALVDGAGHMLHHDQPEAVAHLIEAFLARQN